MSNRNKKTAKQYKLTNGVVYPIYMNGNVHLHMSSGNDKLGEGVWNYSLLPGDEPLKLKNGIQLTNVAGTCGGCCKECKKKCYGIKKAKFRHNTCIRAWGENTVLAKTDLESFFREFQAFIDRSVVSLVRAHMAGEFFSLEYMEGLFDFAKRNKDVTFYFYTKRYEWLERLYLDDKMPDNVKPTVSIWHKNYANPLGFHEFIYDDGTDPEVAKLFHCPAVDKHGHETGVTCAMCKRCQKAKMGMKTAVYAH